MEEVPHVEEKDIKYTTNTHFTTYHSGPSPYVGECGINSWYYYGKLPTSIWDRTWETVKPVTRIWSQTLSGLRTSRAIYIKSLWINGIFELNGVHADGHEDQFYKVFVFTDNYSNGGHAPNGYEDIYSCVDGCSGLYKTVYPRLGPSQPRYHVLMTETFSLTSNQYRAGHSCTFSSFLPMDLLIRYDDDNETVDDPPRAGLDLYVALVVARDEVKTISTSKLWTKARMNVRVGFAEKPGTQVGLDRKTEIIFGK